MSPHVRIWSGQDCSTKVSPWGNPWVQSQLLANHLLPIYSIVSFLSCYQWVRLCGKQGGDGRGKVWHLFLTQHMCLFKNTQTCQLGLGSIDEGWATSHTGFTRVWADACEWGRMDCGVWFIFFFVSIVYIYIKDRFCAQRCFCWPWLLSPLSHLFKADQLPVLGSPALDEAHTDGAHPGELVHSLKALVDWLGQ